jgi:hypothetical protein
VLLVLKLTLVPLLIAGVTLVSRRWGTQIGGVITSTPVVAGPTLSFYAVEQGHAFAATAAQGTLLGVFALAAFCVAYGWCARRAPWHLSLIVGSIAFFAVTPFLYRTQLRPVLALVSGSAVLVAARQLLPVPRHAPPKPNIPLWEDLPVRMVAAAIVVLVLTSFAQWLGPTLSGVLAAFPVAAAILAGFTHAQRGPEAVLQYLRGLLPGLCSFALFCFLLAILLRTWSLAAALALAIAGQMALQAFILWRIRPAKPVIASTP